MIDSIISDWPGKSDDDGFASFTGACCFAIPRRLRFRGPTGAATPHLVTAVLRKSLAKVPRALNSCSGQAR